MAPVFSTLVSTGDLARHLSDADWVVVDCRFDLKAPDQGRAAFSLGHVPGARYAGLEPDLSSPRRAGTGRHPLPDADTFAATLGALGIEPRTQVVAYDDRMGAWASRLWWMLRHVGHQRVAVLDGGLAKWTAEGRPLETGDSVRPPRSPYPVGRPWGAAEASGDGVLGVLSDPGWRLVDARSPERFRGDVEPLDPVAGHVPGAVNAYYQDNVGPDGAFLPVDELRARWTRTLDGRAPARCVCYCGSGVTACHNLLALEHAGLGGASLYVGSWSEWSAHPERPVERGDSDGTGATT